MEFGRKKRHPENIVIRLANRQIHGCRKPGTQLHTIRQFYQNVFPNFTIINVEKPPCFLRKFSPDGKYAIAFSSDQSSLEVYWYQGPAAAADLLQDIGNTETLSNKIQEGIKSKIFLRFFKLKHFINITAGEQLNRECSVFSDDGRYVIIGSASYIPEEIRPHFYEIYTNNESVTPTMRSPLEDYTLHLVDLHLGKLCDTRHFKVDKIFLSHNQGLYLYKDTLAVLSVQHQMIHIFQILDGMFVDVRKIGRFCYEDDLYLYNLVYPCERAFKDVCINSLKHRLLTFLFKRAANISAHSGDPTEIRKFYHYFDNFHSLKMWKMQLLDEDHLLIKYASEEVVTLKQTDANSSEPQFFVVYNIIDSRVIAVYENSSTELVNLYENFSDSFRNACLHSDTQFTCNPSNNLYARLHHSSTYGRVKMLKNTMETFHLCINVTWGMAQSVISSEELLEREYTYQETPIEDFPQINEIFKENILHEMQKMTYREAKAYFNLPAKCSPRVARATIFFVLEIKRYKHTIMIAKFGGRAEAVRRILAHLPISAQSYTTSPYLDYSLFSYDDKWISVMERPKPCGEHPIRFNARDSGYLKFRLYVDNHKHLVSSARRLVAFTFHPTDPFAVSVQRTNSEYIVNFHIRCDNQNPNYNPYDDNQNNCI